MRKTRIAIAGASLFVTLICWALSSPINSHGDEKYYIGSIWCADGYNERCVPLGTDNYGNRVALFQSDMCIPPGIEETYKRLLINRTVQGCQYEINGNQPWKEISVSPNTDYATDRYVATNINTTLSPQYFFRFMNNFVSDNLASSVILMRIVTAAIFCLLLTLLLTVGSLLVNQSVLISLYLTMIPHGFFLSSGITVSGWAYIGCSFSWAFLYVALNSGSKMNLRTLGSIIGWVASGVVVIASRYDAIIYLIFSNFVIVTIKFVLPKPNFMKIGLVLIPLTSLTLFLRSKIQVIEALTTVKLGDITSAFDFILVLGNSVKLAIATPLRIVGIERLGWVDLGPPAHTYITNFILFVAISLIIYRYRTRLQTLTITTVLIFYFLICLSQTYIHPDWSTPFYYVRTSWRNDNFASRYFIPIFPFIIGSSIILAKNFEIYIRSKNFRAMIILILSYTHFSTLDGINKIFRENQNWYWLNFPLGINSIFMVGVTSFFIFLLTTTLIITQAPKS